jgi:transposase-like protein
MDPQRQFCHNPACPARGQVGQGNIGVHSRVEQRYVCYRCGRTFAATMGTAFYRLHTAAEMVTIVLTLLSHGCPVQAIVAAFALDERTVAHWLAQAGSHCQQVHQHLVQQGQVDLLHVQADELWVKLVGQRVWMALALAVPSRLWLGGRISPQRDLVLITGLVHQVRACARCLDVLAWRAMSPRSSGCSASPSTRDDAVGHGCCWPRASCWARWSSSTRSGV